MLLFLLSGLGTFFLTPIIRSFANKKGFLDHPGGRKWQPKPVPNLGGLAVIIPFMMASIIIVLSSFSIEVKNQFLIGILFPSLLIATIGYLDDVYHISIRVRLIVQSFGAAVTSLMLNQSNGGVELFQNQLFNFFVTSLWVITIINAINFLDNMDGLATMLSFVIAVGIFTLSLLNDQSLIAALSLLVSATCFGFVYWNKSPASIYLGDSGSLYLGFMLSALSIRVDVNTDISSVRYLVPLLFFAIPLIDITQVVIRRIANGRPAMVGGRDHLSHILLNNGRNTSEVLFYLISIQVILIAFGVAIAII
jgi:UDP-GlcNAc:undecaprenyl-phosphate GlcNAc-1-phosphate transferase